MSPEPKRIHAEFMKTWEEGYVSTRIAYETMHTPCFFLVRGDQLRDEDGRLDRTRIDDFLRATAASAPVFRLRLQRSFLGLTPPAWVPDDDFDLARHVIYADAPVDLATADIRRLAGDDGTLLSIAHPLWRMRVTELTDGDVAIGCVLHHAILDGQSMMKVMTMLTTKAAGDDPVGPDDPFAGTRAARATELPVLAAARWWRGLADRAPRAAVRSYLSKPLVKRARRVAGRLLLPLRFDAGGEAARAAALPPRISAYTRVDYARARQHARDLGGTLSDLLAAAAIGAWDGAKRRVALRFPVMVSAESGPKARNSVRDISVQADADAPLADRVLAVHEQIAARDEMDAPAPSDDAIGFTTVIPWVSRPRYFAGSEVREVIPFPASLGSDKLAAVGVIYNGAMTVGANMPARSDIAATLDRIAAQLTPPDDGERP